MSRYYTQGRVYATTPQEALAKAREKTGGEVTWMATTPMLGWYEYMAEVEGENERDNA